MTNKTFEHVVYLHVKDTNTYLAIDRLFDDGHRELHSEIPIKAGESVDEAFEFFDLVAGWLGKTICGDNAAIRSKVFGDVWTGDSEG